MFALDGNFAFAFGAGMLATVNPCGFVMLPTYLLYFLGVEGSTADGQRASLRRALFVSAAVTAGFFLVFLTIGLVTRWGFTWIRDSASGWLSIAIGVLLLMLGIVTLFGIHLPIFTPRVDAGGRDTSVRSMFLYGISYAVASIGCTLPTFTGAVLGQVKQQGFVSGVVAIATYGLGMGLVLSALTVSLALARTGLLHGLRRVMQHIDLVSGVVLLLAGAYLVLYGWTSLDLDRESGVVNRVEAWQSDIANWVSGNRGTLGLVLGLITIAAISAVLFRRDRTTKSS
ncbi:MAG: cytochrome c biogenesis CcdA family protein [Acidimicrobiia bacterium]